VPLLPTRRDLFDIPREVAYLNAAYMTPLPRASIAAGLAGLRRKGRPWSVRPADFFTESERARELFARLIGAAAGDIAIVPAASYGLAVAAANLPLAAGRGGLVLADQFPSNVHPWRRLAAERGGSVLTVEAGPDGDLTAAVLAGLDERIAIAALPHCRWTDGRLLDLARIGARCRAIGAALVLDVTQSLGALPLDVTEVRPDLLVCAGYKWLLGPYSLGYLYLAPERQEGRPLEESWIARAGAEDFSRLIDYQEGYQPGARRFDVGERSNFALLPAGIASLELLLDWTPAAIARTLAAMSRRIADRAAALGLEAVPEAQRAGHFLGLRLPPGAPADLLSRLAAADVHVSLRGDRLRVTPHLYNDEADVDRLIEALRHSL
jgi:selenocysteine lyase/cysteine desulfurase